MEDGMNEGKVVPFPRQGGIDLGPGTAYEAITRTKVDELTADVKEIRARIDGIFWLIAGRSWWMWSCARSGLAGSSGRSGTGERGSRPLERIRRGSDLFPDAGSPFRVAAVSDPAAEAIARSVLERDGQQFAVMFSRQSGKDELLAQTVAYLLARYQQIGGSIVLAAPSFHPQAALMRDRLCDRLRQRPAGPDVELKQGYIVQYGRANARFLSASPQANQRGQTADLMLVANAAQDIDPAVWDTVFTPMGASTNATTLFLGTAWRRDTLLARQIAHLSQLERDDGRIRVWKSPGSGGAVAASLWAVCGTADRAIRTGASSDPDRVFSRRVGRCRKSLPGAPVGAAAGRPSAATCGRTRKTLCAAGRRGRGRRATGRPGRVRSGCAAG